MIIGLICDNKTYKRFSRSCPGNASVFLFHIRKTLFVRGILSQHRKSHAFNHPKSISELPHPGQPLSPNAAFSAALTDLNLCPHSKQINIYSPHIFNLFAISMQSQQNSPENWLFCLLLNSSRVWFICFSRLNLLVMPISFKCFSCFFVSFCFHVAMFITSVFSLFFGSHILPYPIALKRKRELPPDNGYIILPG